MSNPMITGVGGAAPPMKGLQEAIPDPAQDPLGYDQWLMQRHDTRVAEQRQAADALPRNGQQMYFDTFNRMQEDNATGPVGYNRQWVPFFEGMNVQAEKLGKNLKVDARSFGRPDANIADDPNSSVNTAEGPFGQFGGGTGGVTPDGRMALNALRKVQP